MTADFGNFIDKTDEKRKTKDEMNLAENTFEIMFWHESSFEIRFWRKNSIDIIIWLVSLEIMFDMKIHLKLIWFLVFTKKG